MSPRPAIIGLGMTPMSVTAGADSFTLGVEAVSAALADAGLDRADADGMLLASTWPAALDSATCACSSTWRSRAPPRSR